MSDAGYSSPLEVNSDANEFNVLAFVISQMLGRIATATLVQVKAVTGGGVGPVGTVDVQPMVNQVNGELQATPHGIIHDLPYVRLTGGVSGIILDPVVGDIGIAMFCSTDISVVKSTGAVGNPGSRRRFDWADGVYLGGVLSAEPEQYAWFAGGITLQSPAVFASGNLGAGSGASGSFSTPTGQVVTVTDGVITDISP